MDSRCAMPIRPTGDSYTGPSRHSFSGCRRDFAVYATEVPKVRCSALSKAMVRYGLATRTFPLSKMTCSWSRLGHRIASRVPANLYCLAIPIVRPSSLSAFGGRVPISNDSQYVFNEAAARYPKVLARALGKALNRSGREHDQ